MHSRDVLLLMCILFGYQYAIVTASPDGKTETLVTQTVYGFLDFTTTIGKTVMIFSPQSAPSLEITQVPKKVVDIIQTKPYTDQKKSTEILPTKLSTNENENKKSTTQATARKDYMNQPDYDLLSRQPEAFAEESYHVVDLISKRKSGSKRTNAAKDPHPVGLVTTLSGKVAMDGTTTIHETSVIGTYISGKYAQVLQSNSHILSPSSTARILRTDSPGSQRPRFKNRPPLDETRRATSTVVPTTSTTHYSSRKHSSGGKHKAKGRQKNKTSKVLRSSHRETEYTPSSSVSSDSRRYAFRQRLNAVLNTTSPPTSTAAPSPSNVKLRPVGRWQYKSTLKPRVYIRKASDFSSSIAPTALSTQNDIELNTVNTAPVEVTPQSSNIKVEKVPNNVTIDEQTTLYPVETINIDIVTPSNLDDVYYEVATIKTPYTFQMGGVKKTRYVTVTSTTEKAFESDYADKSTIKGPLIENILAPTTQINQLLQASSITTFSPCTLSDATETPSLDEFIETYTQSQMKLKTQVFPIVGANQSTSYLTILQTYGVTTLITATRTTPVCIGNNFNEFNTKLDESGSELHLDLEFGDVANLEHENISGSVIEASPVTSPSDDAKKSSTEVPNFYPQFSPEQLQQLAYLKLLQQNGQVPPVSTAFPELTTVQPQPLPSLNPFGLPQPQFRIVTSPIIQPTVLTQTHSRILKLTFGAKTALTTIFSTNVLSTDISTFVTTSLPVQQTPSFASFFPPVFPQYPFLG